MGPLIEAIRDAEKEEDNEPVSFEEVGDAYWRNVKSQPVAVMRNKNSGL